MSIRKAVTAVMPRAVLLLGLVFLSGCGNDGGGSEIVQGKKAEATGTPVQAAGEQVVDALVLTFDEWEAGGQPYTSRVLVTPRFLRMDDGVDGGNFLLFDRDSKTLYSLTNEDQTILRMKRKEVVLKRPAEMHFAAKEKDDAEMPRVDGKVPVHATMLMNDEVCYDVVAVPGLHPDAVEAMRQYLLTLAGEQAANIEKTPPEFRENCMMSNLIYKPVSHLDYGFPIREWSYNGYGRALVDYANQPVSAELFKLDPSFHVYELSDMGLPAKIK